MTTHEQGKPLMSFMINRRRYLQTASASLALSTLGADALDIIQKR